MFWKHFIHLHPRLLGNIGRQFYRYLLSPVCLLCHYPTRLPLNICHQCKQSLPILTQRCRQCAQFLPLAKAAELTCGACLTKPPLFDKTFALFPYQQPIIQWIIQLKFHHQLPYAQAFAELFIEAIIHTWYANQRLPDLIIPVPLHPRRLANRGFNQALEIARPIAKQLNLPLNNHYLKRMKDTQPQRGLNAQQRERNIARAFAALGDFSGLSIALIDDVITTGHTIAACSSVLKKQGAKQIDVWCCARR